MFSLGFGEILLVGIIALIFIGPEQLPEVARTVARLLNEWKRATSDLTGNLTRDFTDDIKNRIEEKRNQTADVKADEVQPGPLPPHEPIPDDPIIAPHEPMLERKDDNES